MNSRCALARMRECAENATADHDVEDKTVCSARANSACRPRARADLFGSAANALPKS